jgi:RimJ/RimL family protein N-acetyltransferase
MTPHTLIHQRIIVQCNTTGPRLRMTIPLEIRTSRVILRPWRAEDAAALEPILATSWEHLGPWIPRRVAEHAPVPLLAQRLSGFEEDFAATKAWRYGMFSIENGELLGEIDLFPRNEDGRSSYDTADRVEIGYWLRADVTGRGLVTEAVQAVLSVATALPRISRAEIRCNARNLPSAAIPQRLGFTLEATVREPTPAPGQDETDLQIWALALQNPRRSDAVG